VTPFWGSLVGFDGVCVCVLLLSSMHHPPDNTHTHTVTHTHGIILHFEMMDLTSCFIKPTTSSLWKLQILHFFPSI